MVKAGDHTQYFIETEKEEILLALDPEDVLVASGFGTDEKTLNGIKCVLYMIREVVHRSSSSRKTILHPTDSRSWSLPEEGYVSHAALHQGRILNRIYCVQQTNSTGLKLKE